MSAPEVGKVATPTAGVGVGAVVPKTCGETFVLGFLILVVAPPAALGETEGLGDGSIVSVGVGVGVGSGSGTFSSHHSSPSFVGLPLFLTGPWYRKSPCPKCVAKALVLISCAFQG